mgnify:FL=1
MIQSNFREWTLDKIDEVFGTQVAFSSPALDKLLSFEYEFDAIESAFLNKISKLYRHFGGEDWNETELENKVISPLFVYAEMNSLDFSYFLERDLKIELEGYQLSGRVDGMIASGFRNPKQPYFCLSEYKKAKDPNGDPQGQALIAMLVAQELNNEKHPVFGCYIVGRQWVFIVLEGKKYAFSKAFTIDDDEIFDIYRVLKSLKSQIEVWIEV